jgi:hypothetical protein
MSSPLWAETMNLLIATILIHPFAGSYTGTYRAGFLNPKPISVTIRDEGTTTAICSQTLTGETTPDGAFALRSRFDHWTGTFRWEGGVLVGTFRTANPLISGVMWLNR